MKSTKAAVKSFKQLVKKTDKNKSLSPNTSFAETVVPVGNDDLFVQLPKLKDTYTFNIINTAEMTGAITLKTSRGASLKGLILNNVGGSLSIEPISQGATSFEMGSDIKDGCFVETISNGSDWFIWSVATNGSLGIGHVGGNSGNPQVSTGTVTQIPAPVEVTITSETTFPAPSLEARHQLTIEGRGEPGTTIQVSEDNGAIQTITNITVNSIGEWGPLTIPELLESGTYHFDFIDESPSNPGAPVVAEEFADNTGALIFTTPNSFTVEQGQTFDFTAGASATDPSGNPIAVNTNANDYSIGLAHNATFDIVYSFTHNGTPYTRTVSGVVKDTIAPAKPTITSANFPSNINDFVATGNAEDGSTVEIFFDGVSQGTVTSTGGTWTFTRTFVFNQTFNITVQATDAAGNVSEESDETSVVYSPPTLTRPTLAIDNAPTNTWTNQANPIEISGTTDAGSTIVIKNGNQTVTPQSGPNYVGDDWTATINVANESNSSLTVEASKANFNSPSPSITKTLLVDRVAPVVTLSGDNPQKVYLGDIGTNNDPGATATDFSSATVSSDWATEVDATEGAKTVTYTATDLAGNSTTETRTVNVTTQVIVPVITSVTDNGDGTATVVGTVTGDNVTNLDIQILVDGVNNGSAVSLSSGSFSITTSTLSVGSRLITAKTINSLGDESAESTAESVTIAISDAAPTVRVFAGHNADGLEHSSNATVNGDATYDLDEAAYVFDNPSGASATGHIFVPYSSDFDRPSSGDLTAQLWFNADRLPSNEGPGARNFGLIARTDAGSTPDGGWILAITTESGFSTGGIQATIFPTPHQRVLPPSGGVTTGVWHHVALVIRNSGTATIYYDGQAISTWTYPASSEAGALSKNYPLIISGFSFNEPGSTIEQHFDGKIKGVAIDQREVSAQEILNNYNNPPLEIADGATHSTIAVDSAFSFIGFGNDAEDGELTPTLDDGGFDAASGGTYTIQHSVTDSYPQTTNHSFSVTVDATAPNITITNDAGGANITNTTVNVVTGDSFAFTATADDGSTVTQTGTYDVNTPATYSLTFDATDAVGNVATQKTLTIEVADAVAWTFAGLKNLNTSTSGPWDNFTIGDSFWKDSTDTAPTVNGLLWPSNGTYDATYAKFADSLDIGSMTVGQTYYVQFRKGRNPRADGSGTAYHHINIGLMDFSAFETFYSSTLGSDWDYSHGGGSPHHTTSTGDRATHYAKHNAEMMVRIGMTRGSNDTGDTQNGTVHVQKSNVSSSPSLMVDQSHANSNNRFTSLSTGINFQKLHRFTIEKTSTGFDLGFDVHDGSSFVTQTIDPSQNFGTDTQKWSVSTLPSTLDIIVFNDQGASPGQTNVVTIQDLTITLS